MFGDTSPEWVRLYNLAFAGKRIPVDLETQVMAQGYNVPDIVRAAKRDREAL